MAKCFVSRCLGCSKSMLSFFYQSVVVSLVVLASHGLQIQGFPTWNTRILLEGAFCWLAFRRETQLGPVGSPNVGPVCGATCSNPPGFCCASVGASGGSRRHRRKCRIERAGAPGEFGSRGPTGWGQKLDTELEDA